MSYYTLWHMSVYGELSVLTKATFHKSYKLLHKSMLPPPSPAIYQQDVS